MTLLLILFCIWGTVELVRMGKEERRKKELARIKAEQERQKRQARDFAIRQREMTKEQAEIEKEQRKQAAVLERHEQRIAALECKVRKLDRDIATTNERIGGYYGQLDWYLLQQSGTVSGGKEFRKWQDKIEIVTDKIRKAEDKIADMKDAKAMAEQELSA